MSVGKNKRLKDILPQHAALDPKDQAEFEKKVKVIKRNEKEGVYKEERGVIYVGHIPHGFYEKEMKSYFNQFGKVTRIRISRSKKTGNMRGYGFVEFQSSEVAQIAAETMNNYLMYEKLLKCEFLPHSRVHPRTFNRCDQPLRKPHFFQQRDRTRHNANKSKKQQQAGEKHKMKSYRNTISKLEELGIHYSLDNMDKLAKSKEEIKQKSKKERQGEEKVEGKIDSTTKDKLVKKKRKRKSKLADSTQKNSSTPKKNTNVKKRRRKSDNVVSPPTVISTPKGDKHVLREDSSDEEITFKTPPFSIKSSEIKSAGASKKKRDNQRKSLTQTPRSSRDKILPKTVWQPDTLMK